MWPWIALGSGGLLLFLFWQKEAKADGVSPKQIAPTPMPTPGKENPSTYFTPPDEAELPEEGWVDFEGMTVTPLPLIDRRTGLFARLRFHDAPIAANRLGGRPLNKAEHDIIFRKGFEIKPCFLVFSAADGMKMATKEFAEKHDACVRKQLDAKGWDGKTPVSNVGKYWLYDRPHVVTNYGWDDAPGTAVHMIQNPGTAHDTPNDMTDNHIDYSQLTLIRKV